MASSGMLRSMALVRTDVSEGLSSSIIRVTKIGKLGTSNRRALIMEKLRSSETSVVTRATRCNIPKDAILLEIYCHVEEDSLTRHRRTVSNPAH
jgi:hypothetical protein